MTTRIDQTHWNISDEPHFNGVNATTGAYLFEPMTAVALAQAIYGDESTVERPDPAHLGDLAERKARTKAHLGVKEGIDPAQLEQAGWGIVFPFVEKDSPEAREQDAIYEALAPLRQLRQSQAAQCKERLYREFRGDGAYRRGESKHRFLAKHGAGSGCVDPEVVPYYLLLVGSPEEIPFHIQTQIDVQYAVGRIHFDTVEEYAHYARSVVEAETGAIVLPREAAFVGVSNYGDMATQRSRFNLIEPLATLAERAVPGWTISRYFDENASKAQVSKLFGGPTKPALLFTSSHGIGFPKGHPAQRQHQGALVLQDWRGPLTGSVRESMYFSADDIAKESSPAGLITFHFACYGAGTPLYDEFALPTKARVAIADQPFVAALPKKLLSHPKGGALATIGHIERAWDASFMAATGPEHRMSRQLAVFESTLVALMKGMRIGAALEYFNQRYAEIAADLSVILADELGYDKPDPRVLAEMWISSRDARGYAILGDPAVRLSVINSSDLQPT